MDSRPHYRPVQRSTAMAAPMDTDPPPNPPLKVWVMSMNRHVSTDEIVRGLNKIDDEEVRKVCLNKPTRDECIRSMISKLYPVIVMQHKLSRNQFRKAKTSTGKEFYQSTDTSGTCLGYSVADTGSLVGMAWAAGQKNQVVNIGLEVMKFSIPRNTTVTDYFESVKHKLTAEEQRDATSGGNEEVLLRRILIILTIKSAYVKAIQQPPGFDYRRMECSLPRSTFLVDNRPLSGWEIRLFKANLGIQRKDALVEEVYQCCAMIYRGGSLNGGGGVGGTAGNQVYWNDKEGEATEMLNFLKVDQIVKAYDGLSSKGSKVRSSTTGGLATGSGAHAHSHSQPHGHSLSHSQSHSHVHSAVGGSSSAGVSGHPEEKRRRMTTEAPARRSTDSMQVSH